MITNPALLTQIQSVLSIFDTPDPSRVWGLSTSSWTHAIDAQTAHAAGAAFGIIKMIDGVTVVPFAEQNYRAMKDAGMLVGGYGWLYSASIYSPGAQARALLAFIKDHPCDIRPGPDFEWAKTGTPNPNFDDLYGYTQPFADGYGQVAMPYTAPGYWNDPKQIKQGSQLGPKSPYWGTLPMWAAEYRTKNNAYIPFGLWPQCKVLQFSAVGNGALYGYPPDGEKEAELNYWQGSLADLYAWCKATPPTPIPVPTPVTAPMSIDALQAEIVDLQGRVTKLEQHP